MTLFEMGTLVRNIQHRAARIEQILTTLVTKEELRDEVGRLEACIGGARRASPASIEEARRPAPVDH
jgi:hypothetical protein